jgi:hypothetical protein
VSQVSRSETLVGGEQSYSFCAGLLAKCAESPIPRLPSDEISEMDSTMDLGIPFTPAPRPCRSVVSPTRVAWSPRESPDEEVLLVATAFPAVPFTSPAPVRAPWKRVPEIRAVSCTEETRFTVSSSPHGSTHWARLTKQTRIKVLERKRRPDAVGVSDRAPRTRCHPRTHKDTQAVLHRWSTLTQWFHIHRNARRNGVELKRGQPSAFLLTAPAPESVVAPQPNAGSSQPQITECSPVDGDASIDAQLAAGARDIPSDLDLVPSLLFPANSKGTLETP